MTWQPDEFEDLGNELRRRMGAELRDEAEEIERLIELQRRRQATLAEVARTAMHGGDSVTLMIGKRRWAGSLTAVGDDYLALDSGESTVECPLASALISLDPARSGGRSGRPESATWRARLAELATDGDAIRLLMNDGEEIACSIEVVAVDHLEVSSDRSSYVPLDLVVAIIRDRSSHGPHRFPPPPDERAGTR